MNLWTRPRTGGSLDRGPDLIQAIEPPIGGGFLSDATPDSFLQVQSRLAGGQVDQMQPPMSGKKLFHRVSSMPASPVHIEPDRTPSQSAVKVLQDSEQSMTVSAGGLNHSVSPQQRSHPAGKVQTLTVLSGSGNSQTVAPFGAAPPQTRVRREATLVLEDHGVSGARALKFFLRPAGTCERRGLVIADKRGWLVSSDSPTDASTSEPALPSVLSRSGALSESPTWGHPTALDSARNPEATSPSPPAAPSGAWHPTAKAAPASAWASELPPPPAFTP